MLITSHFTPRHSLEILVREAALKSKTIPEWNKAIDAIEEFCNLTPEETAWLAGIRYLGSYIRPYV